MSPPKLTYQEFGRSIWRAVIPPLLLLTAHALILSLFLLYWLRTSERAGRTDQVLAAVDNLERLLVNMESGIRGYLLTGEEPFLEPFVKARARIDLAFDHAEKLLHEDQAQLQRLHRTEQLYQAWVGTAPLGATSHPRVDAGEPTIQLLRDRKALMDQMRGQIVEMNLAEAALRDDRYTTESNAIVTGVVGAVGISVSLAIALALINRQTVRNLSSAYRQALDEETASSQQFSDLAEAVPQFIWITDDAGQPTYFNRQWSEFTGRDVLDLRERGWMQSLHPDDQAAAGERWTSATRLGTPFEGEFRIQRSVDGAYRWFLCRALPVSDEQGNVVKWFGSCTDIEEQKQLAAHREAILEAERQARADLTRSARVKDEFLSTLSHELRTPMTAILGWTRLLRDPAFRSRSIDRALEVIESNARVQARLIDDLLDMNRIRTGKLMLHLEPLSLAEVARTVVDSLTPAATARNLKLSLEAASDPPTIAADRGRLQQVVWNLVDNAMRFSNPGGVIRVGVCRSGTRVRLIVSDNGRGISREFLPHVFERFRQADGSASRAHGGLGLGLAIVKSLVEMHGGEITADSDGEGHGATFTVELPPHSAVQIRPSDDCTTARGGAISQLQGRQILVVDDDAETAFIIRSVLEQVGATVTTLHSAGDALRTMAERSFDLLISDIGMPGVDGYVFIRELRMRPSEVSRVPALALTAFARPEDRAAAIDAGFDEHLAKPIDGEELRAAAAALLENAASRDQLRPDPHQGQTP